MLTFNVRDFDDTVVRLIQSGATMDGPIKYPAAMGKVAAFRTPDGHMIGLHEDTSSLPHTQPASPEPGSSASKTS
jgi:predicted enzyme related to lactoylglutathione lyase